ncbi:hypothetical protein AAY53_17835 [Vibrio metoecus]|nr:hypothetical protein AAY53_17835 [Vibrio metoecus]
MLESDFTQMHQTNTRPTPKDCEVGSQNYKTIKVKLATYRINDKESTLTAMMPRFVKPNLQLWNIQQR